MTRRETLARRIFAAVGAYHMGVGTDYFEKRYVTEEMELGQAWYALAENAERVIDHALGATAPLITREETK